MVYHPQSSFIKLTACLCVVRHAFHTVFTYFHNPSPITQQVRVLSVQTYYAMQASLFAKGVRIGSLGHPDDLPGRRV